MTLPDPDTYPDLYALLLPKRFMAWCIDLLITLLLVLVVVLLTAFLTLFIFPLVWFAVAVAYRTVSVARWGATPGMLMMAIKLRGLDGQRPDQTTALWHSALYALQMSFVLPQIASVAMMMTTRYKQGLNDWLTGTVVVGRYIER